MHLFSMVKSPQLCIMVRLDVLFDGKRDGMAGKAKGCRKMSFGGAIDLEGIFPQVPNTARVVSLEKMHVLLCVEEAIGPLVWKSET